MVQEIKKFGPRFFKVVADFICDEYARRKKDRESLIKQWDNIDRQVAMTPDISYKMNPKTGRYRKGWEWMPEIELPNQAETLEVLPADARRMMFPDAGPWFQAHAALTDDYLAKADLQAIIAGDKNEVPTLIDQDAADKLVRGILEYWHGQYDFPGVIDIINAESFAYGMGVGRARLVKKKIFQMTERGMIADDKIIPMLSPRSIRNVYPDRSDHAMHDEGITISGGVIAAWRQLLADLVVSAKQGSSDPDSQNGGWIAGNLRGLDTEDKTVEVLEFEGDLVVPDKEVIYIPAVVVSVARAKKEGKAANRIFRIRFKQQAESSYIFFPYHHENASSKHPTSPLMKGRPIQAAATFSLCRMLMAAALNAQPPIRYDKDDGELVARGGPVLFPGATIATVGAIDALEIGNVQQLLALYSDFIRQYSDVTGVSAPRLGAQTLSHTTAYAKEAELNRGVVRTVDYVRSALKGPMTQWLYLAYKMGRSSMTGRSLVYIADYLAYVELMRDHLPESVFFDVHGAGGPQEEAILSQRRMQSLQMAAQYDQMNMAMGQQPILNYQAAIQQTLREGRWNDVDAITNVQGAIGGNPGAQGIPGATGLPAGAPAGTVEPAIAG